MPSLPPLSTIHSCLLTCSSTNPTTTNPTTTYPPTHINISNTTTFTSFHSLPSFPSCLWLPLTHLFLSSRTTYLQPQYQSILSATTVSIPLDAFLSLSCLRHSSPSNLPRLTCHYHQFQVSHYFLPAIINTCHYIHPQTSSLQAPSISFLVLSYSLPHLQAHLLSLLFSPLFLTPSPFSPFLLPSSPTLSSSPPLLSSPLSFSQSSISFPVSSVPLFLPHHPPFLYSALFSLSRTFCLRLYACIDLISRTKTHM